MASPPRGLLVPRFVSLVAVAVLVAGCGDDGDDHSAPPSTAAATTTTEAPAPEPAPVGRIDDECPPTTGPLDIPAVWPGDPLVAVAGGEPLEIDLAVAIDAGCLVIADTYAAALPVTTPNLGTLEVLEDRTVAYVPPDPPADRDQPAEPWWGEDRVRVCTNVGNGRLGCTNLDIDVWRAEVATLVETFGTDTRPRLMSPLTRGGSNGNGTSIAGLARLQDAFGATWALSLVSTALEARSAPTPIADACTAGGTDPASLWPAAERLLDRFDHLIDITSVELTAVMGREPPDDLAATSNQALQAVEAWVRCQVDG